jgi:Ca-activated chloride channel family protein
LREYIIIGKTKTVLESAFNWFEFLDYCIGVPEPLISVIKQNNKGIDIVMAVDVSGYACKDLKPNRMEAWVAADFVQERPNDRIGLVVYASEAARKMPQRHH